MTPERRQRMFECVDALVRAVPEEFADVFYWHGDDCPCDHSPSIPDTCTCDPWVRLHRRTFKLGDDGKLTLLAEGEL